MYRDKGYYLISASYRVNVSNYCIICLDSREGCKLVPLVLLELRGYLGLPFLPSRLAGRPHLAVHPYHPGPVKCRSIKLISVNASSRKEVI